MQRRLWTLVVLVLACLVVLPIAAAAQSQIAGTVNADMKVGALEETITVSGHTPLVDVQQAARTQVITRDIIDSLPTTRNIMSMGNFVPGIRLGTPDIGGSRSMEQTNPRGHGLGNVHTVQQVDGMSVNSQETSNQQRDR